MVAVQRRANILNLLVCQMWIAREQGCSNNSKVWHEQLEEQSFHFLRRRTLWKGRHCGYYQLLSLGNVKFHISIRHSSEEDINKLVKCSMLNVRGKVWMRGWNYISNEETAWNYQGRECWQKIDQLQGFTHGTYLCFEVRKKKSHRQITKRRNGHRSMKKLRRNSALKAKWKMCFRKEIEIDCVKVC